MKQLDLSGFAHDLASLPHTDPADDPATAIIDGTLAQSLNNDFIAGQQRLFYTDPDAFYRKEGADAVAAVPAVLGRFQELRDRLLDTTVNGRQCQRRQPCSNLTAYQKESAFLCEQTGAIAA